MSTTEVKEIVRDEVKKVIKDELLKHIRTSMKSGEMKKDTNQLIKNALNDLYKFMWNRKSVWQSEIGK